MIFERQFFTLHFLYSNYIWDVNYDYMQRHSQLGKNREIILHLTTKKRNMFKKKARSSFVKQGCTSTEFHFSKITGSHHLSKLNLFQEIPLTLLSSLNTFLTKCI